VASLIGVVPDDSVILREHYSNANARQESAKSDQSLNGRAAPDDA